MKLKDRIALLALGIEKYPFTLALKFSHKVDPTKAAREHTWKDDVAATPFREWNIQIWMFKSAADFRRAKALWKTKLA